MKRETARREIESLDYYLQNHTNDYSEESHTAMMMASKALEQISHLKDRPCEACEFYTEEGCSKWECVFEGSESE